jgi:hypothetical protein
MTPTLVDLLFHSGYLEWHGRSFRRPDFGTAGGGGLSIMTEGPCVSLAKIRSVGEKASSATLLGGQRRSLTGTVLSACLTDRGRRL